MANSWMDTVRRQRSAAEGMARTVLGEPVGERDVRAAMRAAMDAAERRKAPEQKPTEPKKQPFDIRSMILRIVALFTSASCAVASVYFSNIWFLASQPPAMAAIMSITVVATLTTSPEMATMLARKKQYVSAASVIAISLVAMTFSMSSTIGGIYNARTASMDRDAASDSRSVDDDNMAAQAKADIIKASIQRLSTSMATDQGAVSSYQLQIDKALEAGESSTGRVVATLVANRNAAQARVKQGEQRLSELEGDLLGLAEQVVKSRGIVERKDFAAWLGERFGLSADQMEFALAAFPAVFIDVIAPVMLVVAFSL